VDLSQMSREHAERFQEQAAAQEIQLQLCVEPAIFVMGDTARLGEVLANLIDNALKYTPKGGRITLEVEGDEHEARLRVSDTGIGFSPDQAEHLFDRFYRADTSMVQAQAGSGLGLTVVQTIVHAYGGTLSARSRGPSQGSTFEVRFPRTDTRRVA
ncbi:MAG: ATP-binding protein, partial [Planctomycetes bacterium]|nr:ATP-binding protein [Planctomycetota bacterium]